MTVHVNEACVGCGLCVSMCSGVFSMTDEIGRESCRERV